MSGVSGVLGCHSPGPYPGSCDSIIKLRWGDQLSWPEGQEPKAGRRPVSRSELQSPLPVSLVQSHGYQVEIGRSAKLVRDSGWQAPGVSFSAVAEPATAAISIPEDGQ